MVVVTSVEGGAYLPRSRKGLRWPARNPVADQRPESTVDELVIGPTSTLWRGMMTPLRVGVCPT